MTVDSLALGVYGSPVPVHDGPGDEDCYSAFLALSTTLGWASAVGVDGTEPGLWGMNDAVGPRFGDDAAPRGLFQVSPESGSHAAPPVEAFTFAAVLTLERFGAFALSGLEYHVPAGDPGPGARGAGWFSLARPSERRRLRVTLDTGDSPSVVARCDDVITALNDLAPSEEGLDARRLPQDVAVDFAAPVPWRWWLGQGPAHTVTLSAGATEYTALGVARVVAHVVEACRSAGVTGPLGVRIERASDTG